MAGGKRIPGLEQAERAERLSRSIAGHFDNVGARLAEMDKALSQAKGFVDGLKAIGSQADSLGKSLVSLNMTIGGLGIRSLVSGIQRVYELKERWARITGILNTKLGALTPNMKGLMKTSRQWQGTIRGLTDDFEAGAMMFAEYASTLETTGKHVQQFSKIGLQLARGFDLGGKGAGDLVKAFRAMGMTSKDAYIEMGTLTRTSAAFDVNTQQLVKDLSESGEMMAEFGKEGQRSFINSAIYLRRFNIGLKEMGRFMEVFDTFDSAAAEAAAQLNTIFGTTVSSLEIMLEQDPAARFEMVRQQMLAQGRTYENLTRFERKTLADTLQLSEREIAFMLDRTKASENLTEFREKAAKQEVSEQKAQKAMQYQLRKTSETMFAFGIAIDKITVAMANAIAPVLEVFGLAKTGNREFKSFGQVMSAATNQIIKFFKALAKSPEWTKFMYQVADAIRSVGKWISNLSVEKIAGWIDKLVVGMKKFVEYSTYAIAAWAGGKVLGMIKNLTSIGAGIGGIAGKGIGALGGRGMAAVGGAAAGLGAGSLMGGSGAQIGGGIGGAIGGLMGPMGGIIGGVVGAAGGKLVEYLIDKFKVIDRHEERLTQIVKERDVAEADHTKKMGAMDAELQVFQAKSARKKFAEQRLIDIIHAKQKIGLSLTREETAFMRNQIDKYKELGVSTSGLNNLQGDLKEGVKLTKDQLSLFDTATDKAGKKLDDLAASSERARQAQEDSSKATLEYQKMLLVEKEKTKELELGGLRDKEKMQAAEIEHFKGREKVSEKDIDQRLRDLRLQEGMLDVDSFMSDAEKKNAKKKIANEREQLGILGVTTRKREKAEEDLAELTNKRLQFEQKMQQFEMTALQIRAIQQANPVEFEKRVAHAASTGIGDLEARRIVTRGLAQEAGMSPGMLDRIDEFYSEVKPFARGGIVRRPTLAMIGEAGPEAVVPLRATATARRQVASTMGGGVNRDLVNYASSGAKGSGGTVHAVAGDVYLDGRLVGRHLVRTILEESTT